MVPASAPRLAPVSVPQRKVTPEPKPSATTEGASTDLKERILSQVQKLIINRLYLEELLQKATGPAHRKYAQQLEQIETILQRLVTESVERDYLSKDITVESLLQDARQQTAPGTDAQRVVSVNQALTKQAAEVATFMKHRGKHTAAWAQAEWERLRSQNDAMLKDMAPLQEKGYLDHAFITKATLPRDAPPASEHSSSAEYQSSSACSDAPSVTVNLRQELESIEETTGELEEKLQQEKARLKQVEKRELQESLTRANDALFTKHKGIGKFLANMEIAEDLRDLGAVDEVVPEQEAVMSSFMMEAMMEKLVPRLVREALGPMSARQMLAAASDARSSQAGSSMMSAHWPSPHQSPPGSMMSAHWPSPHQSPPGSMMSANGLVFVPHQGQALPSQAMPLQPGAVPAPGGAHGNVDAFRAMFAHQVNLQKQLLSGTQGRPNGQTMLPPTMPQSYGFHGQYHPAPMSAHQMMLGGKQASSNTVASRPLNHVASSDDETSFLSASSPDAAGDSASFRIDRGRGSPRRQPVVTVQEVNKVLAISASATPQDSKNHFLDSGRLQAFRGGSMSGTQRSLASAPSEALSAESCFLRVPSLFAAMSSEADLNKALAHAAESLARVCGAVNASQSALTPVTVQVPYAVAAWMQVVVQEQILGATLQSTQKRGTQCLDSSPERGNSIATRM